VGVGEIKAGGIFFHHEGHKEHEGNLLGFKVVYRLKLVNVSTRYNQQYTMIFISEFESHLTQPLRKTFHIISSPPF
jgi:hypothetical protein